MIIRLLNLDKSQRQPVYKTGNVRTEIVIGFLIFTGKFCGNMPYIVFRIVKVNEFDAAVSRQQLIELSSEVIIVCNADNLGEKNGNFRPGNARIQILYGLQKNIDNDVGPSIQSIYLFKIGITQLAQMERSGNLYPGILVEVTHANTIYSVLNKSSTLTSRTLAIWMRVSTFG